MGRFRPGKVRFQDVTKEFLNDFEHAPLALAKQTPQQMKVALAVRFGFNTTNRLADALGFFVSAPDTFEAWCKIPVKAMLPVVLSDQQGGT